MKKITIFKNTIIAELAEIANDKYHTEVIKRRNEENMTKKFKEIQNAIKWLNFVEDGEIEFRVLLTEKL